MKEQHEIPMGLRGMPDWHQKPFLLSIYEMKFPVVAIKDYLQKYDLDEMREHFKDLFADALDADDPRAKNHLFFLENAEKALEAIYVLHKSGLLIVEPQKQYAFISQFCQELDALLADTKLMTDKIETFKDLQRESYGPQTEHSLKNIKLLLQQIESAQSSMRLIMTNLANESFDLTPTPAKLQTSPFIDSCVRPFDAFEPVFGKSISVKIDPAVQPSFSSDKVKLKSAIQWLLQIAFAFCPQPGYVNLNCTSVEDEIMIAINFEGQAFPERQQEQFGPFELFGNSAIAGTQLYASKLLFAALDITICSTCQNNQVRFEVKIPDCF